MTKFKDEDPDNVTLESPEPTAETLSPTPEPSTATPEPVKGDDSQIVYRERVVIDGVVGEKIHGPMPRSEWARYEKENNL